MKIAIFAFIYLVFMFASQEFVAEVGPWRWIGCVLCVTFAGVAFDGMATAWRERPCKYRLRAPWEKVQ